MDVRAVDTSAMAAQRAELEEIHPSKEKPPFVIGRITPRTSEEAGGRVSRSKSSTERETEQGEDEEREEVEQSEAQTLDDEAEPQIAPLEEHILDVKV